MKEFGWVLYNPESKKFLKPNYTSDEDHFTTSLFVAQKFPTKEKAESCRDSFLFNRLLYERLKPHRIMIKLLGKS